jgi:hypothetical protein
MQNNYIEFDVLLNPTVILTLMMMMILEVTWD